MNFEIFELEKNVFDSKNATSKMRQQKCEITKTPDSKLIQDNKNETNPLTAETA